MVGFTIPRDTLQSTWLYWLQKEAAAKPGLRIGHRNPSKHSSGCLRRYLRLLDPSLTPRHGAGHQPDSNNKVVS